MKSYSPIWSALCLVFELSVPAESNGEAGCLVIEIMMDQPAPLSEHLDRQPSAKREPTSSVRPRGKCASPGNPSLTDQAKLKAFVSGQNMADYWSKATNQTNIGTANDCTTRACSLGYRGPHGEPHLMTASGAPVDANGCVASLRKPLDTCDFHHFAAATRRPFSGAWHQETLKHRHKSPAVRTAATIASCVQARSYL
jgi:hypothetical protein